MKHLYILLLLLWSGSVLIAGEESVSIPRLPSMCFTENKGQITDQFGNPRADIKYAMRSRGITIFAGANSIHYQFYNTGTNKQAGSRIATYRLDMALQNANNSSSVTAADLLPHRFNFYLPQCPHGALDAKSYGNITYHNIYPGTDWLIYRDNGKLKYDFILRPGADIGNIRISYKGAVTIKLTADGKLHIATPFGTITEDAPVAYEQQSKKQVLCSWVQHSDKTWGYTVAPYEGTLVIDPGLDWGTYFGGEWDEFTGDVHTAEDKTVYLCGDARSSFYIATTGAHQDTLSLGAGSGGADGMIAKFNNHGTLLWATYYGGESDDGCNGITTDPENNVYVLGFSGGTSGSSASAAAIATPGAHQDMPAAATDVFIVKLDENGVRQWGTYYGGQRADRGTGITLDADKNIYIIGSTASDTGIATSGAHKSVHTDQYQEDVFLAKFNTNGNLLWGTYYGDERLRDIGSGVAIDTFRSSVYITGHTFNNKSIATPGAYQSILGGASDAFLARFDQDGKLQWGTFYGGDRDDVGINVDVDGDGNIYMVGTTQSNNKIASPNAWQTSFQTHYSSLNSDIFITKFTPEGKRQWGTYYGTFHLESAFDIAVSNCDEVYILGMLGIVPGASSVSGLVTPDGYDTVVSTGNLLLARFNREGKLQWGSYYGYDDGIYTANMSVDQYGNVLLGGSSFTVSGLSTAGAWQPFNNSMPPGWYSDTYLARFQEVSIDNMPDTILICSDTFNLPYKVSDTFYNGNTFTVEISDTSGNFFEKPPISLGSIQDTISGSIQCTVPLGLDPGATYLIRITASSPKSSGSCWKAIRFDRTPSAPLVNSPFQLCHNRPADTLSVISDTTLRQLWYINAAIDTALPHAPVPGTKDTGRFTFYVSQVGFGGFCQSPRIPVEIQVNAVPDASFTIDSVVCQNEPVLVEYNGIKHPDNHYHWNFTTATIIKGTDDGSYNIYWPHSGAYSVALAVDKHGCLSDTVTHQVSVNPQPATEIKYDPLDNACQGRPVQLKATGAISYSWDIPAHSGIISDTITAIIDEGLYIVSGRNEYNCYADDTLTFDLLDCCQLPFVPNAFSPNKDGRNDLVAPVISPDQQLNEFSIYNRWGQLVFRTNTTTDKWDGNYQGSIADIGSYFYQLRVTCYSGKVLQRKGEIILVK